jgi:hypothetical protein
MSLFGWLTGQSAEKLVESSLPTDSYDNIAVEIGKVSTTRIAPEMQRVDPNMPIQRDNRGFHIQSLEQYRYMDVDTLLKQLSKMDPDVSAGIWNFLRLLDSGFKATALDKNLVPADKFQLKLDQMLFRMSGKSDYKTWDAMRLNITQVANQMAKYILLRGGTGLEVVLGKDKRLYKMVVVDPINVYFKQPNKGQFIPYQRNSITGQEVCLGVPTFFWGVLDPDADSPFETPPFLPAVQAVLFNISVMQDLQRIVKRVAFPRISIKIIEQTLRKYAPAHVQFDEALLANWMNSQRLAIGESLKNLAPEDAAVFFDSIDIDMLETKNNATVDYAPLIKVIDQRVITGLKSMPTILGRQFGSSQTLGGVEALLYAKSVACVQDVVISMMERALTLSMQLEGIKGFARCKYGEVSLRPAHEMETFLQLKQGRVLKNLSLGFITDTQAAEELTGDPGLPPTFKPLSGTGFMDLKSAAVDAGAVTADRNPTGSEAAGGGRNKQ